MILFEICRIYDQQPYLSLMYRAIFTLGYYGLMRIGELMEGDHPVKACNFHIGQNKRKILLILLSSKTHSEGDLPQRIKIAESKRSKSDTTTQIRLNGQDVSFFCPFQVLNEYRIARGRYEDQNENLFIFKDRTPVKPSHAAEVLRQCLENINLDLHLYTFHCLRSGRACDMLKQGYTIEQIKYLGRWKSNAVYKYLKLF